MQPERWRRMGELFEAALLQPVSRRAAFLQEACSGDAGLIAEVEALLSAAESADGGSFLNGSPISSVLEAPETMQPGEILNHFKILGLLGRGGMGEVYRALDTRLKREVAIKVVPDSLAGDPQRMARFQREAEVLASLNHPGIAQIYGVEGRALVLELVEGVVLSGPRPLEQALDYARQIVDALDYAHEKGIVHRDLKPSNIMVTVGGVVKILDFGLAKTAQLESRGTPNPSTAMRSPTLPGVILGTAGYMSPEQASGKVVDKRTDIWAFGVVLHELLTGRRLFQRDSIAATLAAVMKDEPDVTAVPPPVRRLLAICLQKDPRNRLRDIADARLLVEPEPETRAAPVAGRRWLSLALALVFIASCFALIRSLRFPSNPSQQVRVTLELSPAASLVGESLGHPRQTAMAFSPDGNTLVFSGSPAADSGMGSQLYRRALDESAAVAIPGTDGAFGPFFSPDGKWVGFWAQGSLKKIPISGGPPVRICELSQQPWGAAWGNGMIVFAGAPSNRVFLQSSALMRVPAGGGVPQPLFKRDQSMDEAFSAPEFLPDGNTLVFTRIRNRDRWSEAQIVARRLDTGEQHVLVNGGSSPHYVPTGHLLYMQDAVLMAVSFDARRLQCIGTPVSLQDGVMHAVNSRNPAYESGIGQFAVSNSGHLVYAPGGIFPALTTTLMRVDRAGRLTSLNLPKGIDTGLRLSPDGKRLAFSRRSETSRLSDIWVCDLVRGTTTRLTARGDARFPLWSLDGMRILFTGGASENQIFSVQADGQGTIEVVVSGQSALVPASWSPDGNWLAYLGSDSTSYKIWVRSVSERGDPRVFAESKVALTDAGFSPDGKWIAYGTYEAGRLGVYAQAFPGPGERHRLSSQGGRSPAWRPDGRELFYLVMSKWPDSSLNTKWRLMAVDVKLGSPLQVSVPRALFEGVLFVDVSRHSFDVYPDGRNFIVAYPDEQPDHRSTRLHLILNWFDEVRRRAPVKNY